MRHRNPAPEVTADALFAAVVGALRASGASDTAAWLTARKSQARPMFERVVDQIRMKQQEPAIEWVWESIQDLGDFPSFSFAGGGGMHLPLMIVSMIGKDIAGEIQELGNPDYGAVSIAAQDATRDLGSIGALIYKLWLIRKGRPYSEEMWRELPEVQAAAAKLRPKREHGLTLHRGGNQAPALPEFRGYTVFVGHVPLNEIPSHLRPQEHVGGMQGIEVDSPAAAVRVVEHFRDATGMGGSAAPRGFGNVVKWPEGQVIGRVSYNGRYWVPRTPAPAGDPLFLIDRRMEDLLEQAPPAGSFDVVPDPNLWAAHGQTFMEKARNDIYAEKKKKPGPNVWEREAVLDLMVEALGKLEEERFKALMLRYRDLTDASATKKRR